MKSDNIVLIGMPASGKSTVGVILAKLLGYDFIDADLLIQRRQGRLLSEIIRDKGLDGFLALENDVCRCINASHAVIATGGSAVYGEEAMRHLREIGWIVWLNADFETIRGRLSDIRGRGVVLRDGQTLEALYEERAILYRRWADLTVNEDSQGLEATVEAVRRSLEGKV